MTCYGCPVPPVAKTFVRVRDAWLEGRAATRVNDSTDGTYLYCHGRAIGRRLASGHVWVTTAGYGTYISIRRRLCALCGPEFGVHQHKHVVRINGVPWESNAAWLDITLLAKYWDDLSGTLALMRVVRHDEHDPFSAEWSEVEPRHKRSALVALLHLLATRFSEGGRRHVAWEHYLLCLPDGGTVYYPDTPPT